MRNLRLSLRRSQHPRITPRFQSSKVPKTGNDAQEANVPDEGAMTRRLSEMTETALETGKSARQTVEDAGFDENLRRRLQDRIASAGIRSEYPSAFTEVEAPSAARRDAREIAGARPWSGTESVEESSRRMLEDSHRRPPPLARSLPITARIPKVLPGSRIENAMDQSANYAALKESGMSAEEKEQFLKEQRERFQPGARDIPSTLSGLASLANERIEEAMARGLFKGIPRGRPQDVDHNSSSPFIDTTEYLMNKMLKRQELVPPWIDKQNELSTAVRRFRARLRSDWKRHAARVIASQGGNLSQQMRRAEDFAAAELALTSATNAPQEQRSSDQVTPISSSGQLPVGRAPDVEPLEQAPYIPNPNQTVFRDPVWETTERAFHELSVKSLNDLTRTYNLMAPRSAQRPYHSLQRELKACFADVAPLVGEEIRHRAASPRRTAVVERATAQGVSEFRWKDVWKDIWTAKGL
jgi:hypothetical protein